MHGMSRVRIFDDWLAARGYALGTRRLYLGYARRYLAWLDGTGIAVAEARPEELRAWLASLPATASSRNGARKMLLGLYRALEAPANPAERLEVLPERRGRPRPLSAAQHQAFLGASRHLGGVHAPLGMMFGLTGARISEIRLARWHQIDFAGATWCIQGKGSRRAGPKRRVVPLHAGALDALAAWAPVSRSEYVFSTTSATCVSDPQLRRWFAQICEAAGLDHIRPHQLRHTVATLVLREVQDLRVVQELLGHESVATTQIYTAVDPERIRAGIQTLEVP